MCRSAAGYDSRLLCSVAVAKGADVESWTTSPDDGTDTDIAFARAITREARRTAPRDHPGRRRLIQATALDGGAASRVHDAAPRLVRPLRQGRCTAPAAS
ncbi:hypothetical protein GCM10020219_065590 [Nonomuraea dietziae]